MEVEEIQLLFFKAGHFQSRAGYRVLLETPINCISVTGAGVLFQYRQSIASVHS